MTPPPPVVDEALVRTLLRRLPDPLAHVRGLPVTYVAQGWDNSVWRVGDALAARVAVRDLAVPLLANEARWARDLAAPLAERGVPVTTAVHLTPGGGPHPLPWLLTSWVHGELIEDEPVDSRHTLVPQLTDALAALHRPAPADAPVNPFRGPDLRDLPPPRPSVVTAAASWLGDDAVACLRGVLAEASAAPPWPTARAWCHGDLHPRNLVRTPQGGVGVLDLGDLTAGDPAVDLAVLWTAFDAPQRARAVARLEHHYDEHVWVRARGWAARFAVGVAGHQPEPFAATLRHVLAQLACA